jgi:hypothetical protein
MLSQAWARLVRECRLGGPGAGSLVGERWGSLSVGGKVAMLVRSLVGR